jgi:hypothetical protein
MQRAGGRNGCQQAGAAGVVVNMQGTLSPVVWTIVRGIVVMMAVVIVTTMIMVVVVMAVVVIVAMVNMVHIAVLVRMKEKA